MTASKEYHLSSRQRPAVPRQIRRPCDGTKTAANNYVKIALEHYAMRPAAPVGYLAASLVFATFCTKRMVSLRALAIASNAAFIGYGYLDVLWPILILHAAMMPLNIRRLRQAVLREHPGGMLGRHRIVNWRRRSVAYRGGAYA